jgi:hypothetical protein
MNTMQANVNTANDTPISTATNKTDRYARCIAASKRIR